LAKYSDYILSVSAEYDLDWRILTAIAGAESTFGRNIPDNCYNAWGWGIHSRGTLCFGSWKEGIRTVARGLKEKFLDDGLNTIDEIMARYAPVSLANGGSWAQAVNYFMDQLEHAEYYE
jgi:membrane-bound lytic murein transglycosylase B